MMVYWAHLYAIPASIISAMNKLMASFIWGDRAAKKISSIFFIQFIQTKEIRRLEAFIFEIFRQGFTIQDAIERSV